MKQSCWFNAINVNGNLWENACGKFSSGMASRSPNHCKISLFSTCTRHPFGRMFFVGNFHSFTYKRVIAGHSGFFFFSTRFVQLRCDKTSTLSFEIAIWCLLQNSHLSRSIYSNEAENKMKPTQHIFFHCHSSRQCRFGHRR